MCAIAITAVGSACGGSGGGLTGTPQPAIQKAASASGDAQTALVGTALTSPLRVTVTLSGTPQQGTTVTWAAGGSDGSVSPTSSVTDAGGIATTAWTLGQTAGAQRATASLAGATGSPVTFTASATPGAATQLVLSGGDGQTGTPNATLSGALKVKVGDQFGNGVQGVSVAWQVTGGTASVQPASSSTDASGIAQTAVTLGGTLGPVTITATSAALTGSPVTFHATVGSFPSSAAVQIGDNFFKSSQNLTNPAVDTIGVNGVVTWTWTGLANHSVQSTGSPSFTSSTTKATGTYSFTFTSAGTYIYDCIVHGTVMSGTIVVK
jgi:adhesin/invasin